MSWHRQDYKLLSIVHRHTCRQLKFLLYNVFQSLSYSTIGILDIFQYVPQPIPANYSSPNCNGLSHSFPNQWKSINNLRHNAITHSIGSHHLIDESFRMTLSTKSHWEFLSTSFFGSGEGAHFLRSMPGRRRCRERPRTLKASTMKWVKATEKRMKQALKHNKWKKMISFQVFVMVYFEAGEKFVNWTKVYEVAKKTELSLNLITADRFLSHKVYYSLTTN